MSQSVKDLINAIVEGDASNIDAAFNSAMAEKVSSKLEDMRVSVAQNMFATPVAEEVAEEYEELDEELDFEEINEEEESVLMQSLSDEEINEALDEEDAAALEEKYMGFAKLKASLARKPGVKNPAAVAAAIGRKKYGKEKFQKMATAGKKKVHEEVEHLEEATYEIDVAHGDSSTKGEPLDNVKKHAAKYNLKVKHITDNGPGGGAHVVHLKGKKEDAHKFISKHYDDSADHDDIEDMYRVHKFK